MITIKDEEVKQKPGAGVVAFAIVLLITAFAMGALSAFGTFDIMENDPETKHFYEWLRIASIHLILASIASAVMGIGVCVTRGEVK